MIIAKPYSQGDIVSFKLTSGEEMIARYSEESMTEYKVNKPVNLVPTPNGGLGMVPALFSAELNTNSISLQKSAVILHSTTKKEIADEYVKGTTGIKPVSSLPGGLGVRSQSS